MKFLGGILVLLVLLIVGGPVRPGFAQQQAPPPNIDLLVTETLNQLATSASKRDDLREAPAPRADRLSDSIRVTVTVGDPRCLPGEDDWVGAARLNSRSHRPPRTRQ